MIAVRRASYISACTIDFLGQLIFGKPITLLSFSTKAFLKKYVLTDFWRERKGEG